MYAVNMSGLSFGGLRRHHQDGKAFDQMKPVPRSMSTVHFTFCALLSMMLAVAPAYGQSVNGPLRPYKDELFSAQTVLESKDGGANQSVDYDEMRDINGRDEIPERRVKRQYVSMGYKKQQAMESLPIGNGKLDVGRVGPASGQAFTVIFTHGRGGDRRLGMNDYTFGGNFNRLKNLAADNGGTYYAPSIRSFDAAGVAQTAALIDFAYQQSGGKPVILSCASMGSFICYGIARDRQVVSKLKGMAILGGAVDPEFPSSVAASVKLPVWFTHGSLDKVYSAEQQEAMYRGLRKNGQPVRFTVFVSGSHGTPVRMTDWRAVLNWLLVTK
jgi:hypothetical protein